jgi:ABC-2 type transport system permease protein
MPSSSATAVAERSQSAWGILRLLWFKPAIRGLSSATPSEAVRSLAFGVAGLFFLATLYSIFKPVTAFLWSQPELGPVLSARVLSIAFSLLFLLLGFSSLLAFLSRLVFSDDAALFAASPLDATRYYSLRLWQAFFSASWMIFILWFPYLWALRKALGLGWGFALWGALAPWPMAALAAALAAGLLSALIRALPPERLRNGLFAAAVLAGLSALLALRFVRPERLADPETAQTVAGYLASLDRLEPVWWPATWASRAVLRAPFAPGEALAWWLLSLAAAVTAWNVVVRRFGPRAWDDWYRGQESGLANTGAGQGKAFHATARRPAWRILMEREGVALWRGPGQKLQALLLASLIALFTFSLWRLPLGDDTGLKDYLFLPVCALAQVILLAVGARFVFPAGSLESPASWILFSAPVPAREHLIGKIALFILPLLPLSVGLDWAVSHVFQPAPLAFWLAALNFAATPLMLACLNTGLGVAWARHDASQPEEVIGSPAGVLAMVLCTLTVLAQNALAALPLRDAYYAELSHRSMAWAAIAMPAGLWITLQAAAVLLPLRAGLRRIEGRA